MALVVFGMKCPLCGRALQEGQNIVAFPPFVANELDPLWLFSDGAFHADCFSKHPLATQALARSEEAMARGAPEERFCVVCGRRITDPDDFFGVGHLVDDVFHALHAYNYIQAHRSCLPDWPDLPRLHNLLEALKRSGTWQGTSLEKTLSDLQLARARRR